MSVLHRIDDLEKFLFLSMIRRMVLHRIDDLEKTLAGNLDVLTCSSSHR